jgi:hypothetical protein
MDMCAQLIKHLLSSDTVEMPKFEVSGNITWPNRPPGMGAKSRKIILYQEFTKLAPLLQRVGLARRLVRSSKSLTVVKPRC